VKKFGKRTLSHPAMTASPQRLLPNLAFSILRRSFEPSRLLNRPRAFGAQNSRLIRLGQTEEASRWQHGFLGAHTQNCESFRAKAEKDQQRRTLLQVIKSEQSDSEYIGIVQPTRSNDGIRQSLNEVSAA